jgi:hypothetical protein
MWFIDDRAVGRKLLVIRFDTRERDQTALSIELKSINSAFELVDAVIESTAGSGRQSAAGPASDDALIKEKRQDEPAFPLMQHNQFTWQQELLQHLFRL